MFFHNFSFSFFTFWHFVVFTIFAFKFNSIFGVLDLFSEFSRNYFGAQKFCSKAILHGPIQHSEHEPVLFLYWNNRVGIGMNKLLRVGGPKTFDIWHQNNQNWQNRKNATKTKFCGNKQKLSIITKKLFFVKILTKIYLDFETEI